MRQAVRAIIIQDGRLLTMHRNKFGHQYYMLIGGGINAGEVPAQALAREIAEEASLQVTGARPVFIEDGGDLYGMQYVYLCEVAPGNDPQLAPGAPEVAINALGQNIYTPTWLPLKDLPSVTFRSPALQKVILYAAEHGFPPEPVQLDAAYLDKVQSNIAKKV